MLLITRILVPIDWSESSLCAFQIANSLAADHDAELVLLHVLPVAAAMYGPPTEAHMKHLQEELCRMKPTDPKVHITHLMAEGDSATAILRTASEAKCDLIVMGTHGRTGLNRALMGSVAETVVRKACCMVLTVKSPEPVKH